MSDQQGSSAGPDPVLDPPLGPLDVVIVAAGTGSRMGGIDKLTADLAGRPVLARAIAPFAAMPEVERIVVVTAPDRVSLVRDAPWLPSRVSVVVAGGARRQESVAAGVRWLAAERSPTAPEQGAPGSEPGDAPAGNGSRTSQRGRAPANRELASAERSAATGRESRVVLVHDGARPLVGEALIRRVAAAARRYGAAIPVLPVADTVKRIDGDRVAETVDRSGLAVAQTPQAVRLDLLDAAYTRFPPDGPETWTDEAALLEACTITVHAVSGDPGNLKVTRSTDLALAELLLAAGDSRPRFWSGLGLDSHPFGPGEPLLLGGVVFEGAPRLAGHSDGDVVLHAVADALLGAAALGDLGRLFPAGPETPRGIAGSTLLVAVLGRVRGRGLRPTSVDVTIVAERPRLGTRLEQIRTSIAGLLELSETRVSVKASTGNLDGMAGAGRGISAIAIATLEAIP